MHISPWQLSTLILSTLFLGKFFYAPADAAPADVHGSPSVAVSSYRTKQGSYVLWADGHVSKADTGVALGGCDANQAPGMVRSQLTAGRTQGAANVAVGLVPTPQNTFVLFGDGSIRKPVDSGAAAGPDSGSAEYLLFDGGQVRSSSPGLSLTVTGGGQYRLEFGKSYATRPTVVVSRLNMDGEIPSPTKMAPSVIYEQWNVPTVDHCLISEVAPADFGFCVSVYGL